MAAKRKSKNLRESTELGLEKFCSRCKEWWPADVEFFYSHAHEVAGLYCYCRACTQLVSQASKARLAKARSGAVPVASVDADVESASAMCLRRVFSAQIQSGATE